MPTIHREAGFRFSFYSDEPGEPPHIHVRKGGGKAKIWLDPVSLAGSRGFGLPDLAAMFVIVRANVPHLLDEWHGFFGTTHPERAPRR